MSRELEVKKFSTFDEYINSISGTTEQEPFVADVKEDETLYITDGIGASFDCALFTIIPSEDAIISFTPSSKDINLTYIKDEEIHDWSEENFAKIEVSKYENIKFYGNNPNGLNESKFKFSFKNEDPDAYIALSGNLITLVNVRAILDDEKYKLELPERCFSFLFSGSKVRLDISALVLPSVTSNYCYYSMFKESIFVENTDVKDLFEYLMDDVKEYAFAGMFERTNVIYGCNIIANKILPHGCLNMFYYCENLVSAGTIDVSEVQLGGCEGMYSYCYNLMTLPDTLPALILGKECYKQMFYCCSSITYINDDFLPATILKESCYNQMFAYCGQLDNAPLLNSNNLADSCYYQMFMGTTPPSPFVLPAERLASKCYKEMFLNSNINEISLPNLMDKLTTPYIGRFVKENSVGVLNLPADYSDSYIKYLKEKANITNLTYWLLKRDFYSDVEYVDLGLPSGTLWAKYNIGASNNDLYGNYYMFGSTTDNSETQCIWKTAPFNRGGLIFEGDYWDKHKYNFVNEDGILKSDYDAAQVMDKSWEMPLKEDFIELAENSTQVWVEGYSGTSVNGVLLTSTSNGETLFFPAAGSRVNSAFLSLNRVFLTWTKEVYLSNGMDAVSFSRNSQGLIQKGTLRYRALPIRPIHKF